MAAVIRPGWTRRRAAARRALPLAVALAALAAAGLRAQAPTGWVRDEAGLLPAGVVERLDRKLAAHEAATSNQVVVETVPSLGGVPLEEFSLAEAERLRIGQRGRDNGVLLLVALHDRAARIEVGYGLEERLTDALCGRILRERAVPRFREGDYAGGIEAAVDSILGALDGSAPGPWIDRVPVVSTGLERARGWLDRLPPPGPPFEQAFLGIFLFVFGPILSLLVFAWLPWKKAVPWVGLTLFALVAIGLVSRYPWLLGGPGFLGLLALVHWVDKRFLGGRIGKLMRSHGGGSGGRGGRSSGGGSSWSSSSRSSSSSFSGGGGSFGGGGASARW